MKKTTLIGGGLAISALAAALLYFMPESEHSESQRETGGIERSASAFRAGTLGVSVIVDPPTPRVGDNTLIIEIRDADGEPVSDVDVDAFAEMPAMGAMPAMRAPAGLAQTEPGRFVGEVNLSMRGEWPLTVTITDPARGDQRLKFDLATDRAELSIASGGTPHRWADDEHRRRCRTDDRQSSAATHRPEDGRSHPPESRQDDSGGGDCDLR